MCSFDGVRTVVKKIHNVLRISTLYLDDEKLWKVARVARGEAKAMEKQAYTNLRQRRSQGTILAVEGRHRQKI